MAGYWRFVQLCEARWTRLPLMFFFHNEDFPKIVGLCLECYSHTYMMQYIKCIFPPNIYWIRASISIRRWKKIAFDQSNRVGFMALLLIKQKCIEPSTNMKQVRYGFFLHEINRCKLLLFSKHVLIFCPSYSDVPSRRLCMFVSTVYYWNFPVSMLLIFGLFFSAVRLF